MRIRSKKKNMVVILGAGTPFSGQDPSALVAIPGHRRVLDWILEAMRSNFEGEFHFIGGYRIEEVIRNYPNIFFSVNPDWKKTGSVQSLLAAPLDRKRATFTCYSDVVFSPQIVRRMHRTPGDAVIAVDVSWKDRYLARTRKDILAAEKAICRGGNLKAIGSYLNIDSSDAEFIGLVKLRPQILRYMLENENFLSLEKRSWGMPDLLSHFLEKGFKIRCVTTKGQWAELNAPQDLARFVLGTKAETLSRLKPLVRKSIIGEQVAFTCGDYTKNPSAVINAIREKFKDQLLIVRSSALSEDGWLESMAGGFTSVLQVPSKDLQGIDQAVKSVISSYGDSNPSHQILVQKMVENIKLSGVLFTKTLTSGAPYYTINFDDKTKSTFSVTSGMGNDLRTVIIHRDCKDLKAIDGRLADVIEATRELEDLVGHDSLDIEFAVLDSGIVHIFQVRPIAVDHSQQAVPANQVGHAISKAVGFFQDRQKTGPYLFGKKAIFGNMPDWNPAEIIGTRPRQLAYTLYRYLVTDSIWAAQRAQCGYRDVRPCPLMIDFAGHPYVDVRASFNSFVPSKLDCRLQEKLVEHYLNRLEQNPHLHDKIEFDIALTCVTFDFDNQLKRLRDAGFTQKECQEIRKALLQITKEIIQRVPGDLEVIETLRKRTEKLSASDLSPLDMAFALLEDCKLYGTLPFSHLARGAFVAVSLIRSLKATGVLTARETNGFLNSIRTVAKEFESHARAVSMGTLDWDTFISRYGHLRPGTYEITSPTYSQDAERFLRPLVEKQKRDIPAKNAGKQQSWDGSIRRAIEDSLKRSGLASDYKQFEGFLRGAIEGREYSKFVFTKSLSLALDKLAEFGNNIGITPEQLSHISIHDLLGPRTSSLGRINLRRWLESRTEEGEEWHQISYLVELPHLIFSESDIHCFERLGSHPNFVTNRRVRSEVIGKEGWSTDAIQLSGKIALVLQADPGYDWLFGHNIAGLITAYGGANSHMAIRAAEFGLPAAIGVGEKMYDQLCMAEVVELDCATQRIRIIR